MASLRAEDGEHVTPRGLGVQPAAAAEPAGVSGFISKFMRILHAALSYPACTAGFPPESQQCLRTMLRVYLLILGLFVPWLLHRVTLGVCSSAALSQMAGRCPGRLVPSAFRAWWGECQALGVPAEEAEEVPTT